MKPINVSPLNDLGATFDIKKLQSHHDYESIDNAPVSILDIHGNSMDMRKS
jgi:hypothetical protein